MPVEDRNTGCACYPRFSDGLLEPRHCARKISWTGQNRLYESGCGQSCGHKSTFCFRAHQSQRAVSDLYKYVLKIEREASCKIDDHVT
jgi:hypothetical protein